MKWIFPIPLPGDTHDVLRQFPPSRCRNPGLVFERYVPDWSDRSTLKKAGLELVRRTGVDTRLLAALERRWRALLRSRNAVVFEASPQWRLIVGLGRKGPLEVGFAFHRLYGIPVIPGSSLKGIARAYACLILGKCEEDPDFCAIFGRGPGSGDERGQAGRAIFFDAIPVGEPRLELDVMNPHFPRYYQGDEAPSDWQNPTPIYFLTVGQETRFLFGVGWRGKLDEDAIQLRDIAARWLKEGLQELGAGAKTSAGYGFLVEARSDQEGMRWAR